MAQPSAPPQQGTTTSAWHDRDFIKLWCSQATGLIGQQFSVLALPLVAILTLNGKPATVALLVGCFSVPWIVLGLFVGVIVDRFPRRAVLIVSDLGRALLLASIPLGQLLGFLSMQQLFVLAFLVGTLDVFWLTAYRSYVPVVVPRDHLARAYALVGASDGVTRTAAPSLAGLLIQVLGPPGGMAITCISYVTSALFNSRIRRREPQRTRHDHEPIVQAFRDGLAYAWRQHVVRAFALSEATFLFFRSVMMSVLLVFLARSLHVSPAVIGLIFTLGTIGGILGAATARRIGRRLTPGRTILAANIVRSLGIASIPLAVVTGPAAIPILMTALLVASFGWTIWDVHSETVQQQLLPDRFRGRVTGSVLFLTGSSLALGALTGAALVAATSVTTTLILGSLGTLLASSWLIAVKIWTIRRPPESPDHPANTQATDKPNT